MSVYTLFAMPWSFLFLSWWNESTIVSAVSSFQQMLASQSHWDGTAVSQPFRNGTPIFNSCFQQNELKSHKMTSLYPQRLEFHPKSQSQTDQFISPQNTGMKSQSKKSQSRRTMIKNKTKPNASTKRSPSALYESPPHPLKALLRSPTVGSFRAFISFPLFPFSALQCGGFKRRQNSEHGNIVTKFTTD